MDDKEAIKLLNLNKEWEFWLDYKSKVIQYWIYESKRLLADNVKTSETLYTEISDEYKEAEYRYNILICTVKKLEKEYSFLIEKMVDKDNNRLFAEADKLLEAKRCELKEKEAEGENKVSNETNRSYNIYEKPIEEWTDEHLDVEDEIKTLPDKYRELVVNLTEGYEFVFEPETCICGNFAHYSVGFRFVYGTIYGFASYLNDVFTKIEERGSDIFGIIEILDECGFKGEGNYDELLATWKRKQEYYLDNHRHDKEKGMEIIK